MKILIVEDEAELLFPRVGKFSIPGLNLCTPIMSYFELYENNLISFLKF